MTYRDQSEDRFANSATKQNVRSNSNTQNSKYAHIKCKFCNTFGHSAQVCPELDNRKPSANAAVNEEKQDDSKPKDSKEVKTNSKTTKSRYREKISKTALFSNM